MLTRRWLAAGAAATLVMAAVVGPTGSSAAALRDPGAECPIGQAHCDVWENEPGDSGDGGSTNPGGSGNDGADRVCKKDSGETVKCYDDVLGWFNSSDDCYYKVHEPQPPGVEPGMTAYLRTCGDVAAAETVFLADPPAGFDPPDPEEIANELLASVPLARPVIQTAPQGEPGLVGVPVWLYDASSWESVEDSDEQGGVEVSIEAIPTKTVWKMGNGVELTCPSKGIPFDAARHEPRNPPEAACTYAGYPRSSRGQDGGTYPIEVTKHWRVPWSSSTGAGGELATTRFATAQIQIDELQVVTG